MAPSPAATPQPAASVAADADAEQAAGVRIERRRAHREPDLGVRKNSDIAISTTIVTAVMPTS